MRFLTTWLPLSVAAVASSCGATSDSVRVPAGPRSTMVSHTATVLERQFGEDANGFYLFTPRRRSWNRIVVFVHGHGGPSEITPNNHRPWLQHLAERGSAVIYPRYEEHPGGHAAARHIDTAVRSALAVLGTGRTTVPVVGI